MLTGDTTRASALSGMGWDGQRAACCHVMSCYIMMKTLHDHLPPWMEVAVGVGVSTVHGREYIFKSDELSEVGHERDAM